MFLNGTARTDNIVRTYYPASWRTRHPGFYAAQAFATLGCGGIQTISCIRGASEVSGRFDRGCLGRTTAVIHKALQQLPSVPVRVRTAQQDVGTLGSSILDFTRKYPEKRSLTAEKVELNRADTLMLRTIPGIGARTAREIISYRERLGGFTDMGQLLEIRIIDSARWRQITPYLSIDTTGALHKLRINHASVNELVKHPYIDYYLAKTIVVWRDNKGRFRSLDEMRSATRVYPELYNRLKPYLTTQ